MATAQTRYTIFQELADLFTSDPSREKLLRFRPSPESQKRAQTLLEKQNTESLTVNESRQLDQFLHAELFMRLVKARLRRPKAPHPSAI
jgi:hypothetical protein